MTVWPDDRAAAVLTPYEPLDTGAIRQLLADQFGATGATLEFQPVGEDSWCYRYGSLWLNLRRDVQGHVAAAYVAAHRLADAGFEFVVSPLAGADGRVVRLVQGIPVVVFPYVDAVQVAAGTALSPAEADAVVTMMSRLSHCDIPVDLPVEDFRLPFADRLAQLVGARPQYAGPFGERLARLLRAHRGLVTSMIDEATRLGQRCAVDRGDFGITHGDFTTANILRDGGRLVVVDWGMAKWGPPERDWYHLARTSGLAPVGVRPALMRFYHLRWQLSEIAEYVQVFSAPHRDDEDSRAMWQRLLRYLPAP